MRKQFLFPCLLACAVASALALPERASANMVTNGGFETGDFTGWTAIGDSDFSFSGVSCPGAGSVSEGVCDAYFSTGGISTGIKQTLNTEIGQTFDISFDYLSDGSVPDSFEVDFGGQVLLAQKDGPTSSQTYSFSAVATTANTDLAFLFQDDLGFVSLDNVTVAAVPEPTNVALIGIGLVGLVARRWRGKREVSGR
jgi:PEP-CTERM motif